LTHGDSSNKWQRFFRSAQYISNDRNQIEIKASAYYFNAGADGDDQVLTDFNSDIIPSLKVQGNEIVFTPTGTVCGLFKKDVFGSSYSDNSDHCVVTIVQKDVPQQDPEGFDQGTVCEFIYTLEIN
jgi:hypothetical protein